jgi:hypothetical protein
MRAQPTFLGERGGIVVRRHRLFLFASVAAASVLAIGNGSALAATNWYQESVPSPDLAASLTAVKVFAWTNVWAVGSSYELNDNTLAEHFDGNTWKVVQTPHGSWLGPAVLRAIDGINGHDLWVVGNRTAPDTSSDTNTVTRPLTEHWNGTTWSYVASPVSLPHQNDRLTGIAAISVGNAWAVGYTESLDGTVVDPLLRHWNGTAWQSVTPPDPVPGQTKFDAVSATSASNVWAVGSAGTHGLISHWNGQHWSSTLLGTNELLAVDARTGTDAWAVGPHSTTLRWNGHNWSAAVHPTAPYYLSGIAFPSANRAFAIGTDSNNHNLVVVWNGQAWQRDPLPSVPNANFLTGVSASDPSTAFTVGFRITLQGRLRTQAFSYIP